MVSEITQRFVWNNGVGVQLEWVPARPDRAVELSLTDWEDHDRSTLGLTPDQARELAGVLLRAASEAQGGCTHGPANNWEWSSAGFRCKACEAAKRCTAQAKGGT